MQKGDVTINYPSFMDRTNLSLAYFLRCLVNMRVLVSTVLRYIPTRGHHLTCIENFLFYSYLVDILCELTML